jgi:hypothetical protein
MNTLNKDSKTIAIFFLLLMSSCNYFPCGWNDDLNNLSAVPQKQTLICQYFPDEFTKENH